jgi:hypothetical protein
MGKAMRDLGWERPSKSALVRINGKVLVGYVKGNPPWGTINAAWDNETRELFVSRREEQQTSVDPDVEFGNGRGLSERDEDNLWPRGR